MNILYSFYKHNNLNKDYLKLWIVSYEHTKKYLSDKISIYSNDKNLSLIFDNIIDLPKLDVDSKWWNIHKLWIYKEQTESFLHIDNDIIFTNYQNIPEIDIICEKMRDNNMTSSYLNYWNIEKPLRIICSGILGGYNLDIFKEQWNMIYPYVKQTNGNITNNLRNTIEETILSYLKNKYNLDVYEMKDFKHFQGKLNKINISNIEYVNELYEQYRNVYDVKINNYIETSLNGTIQSM